MNKQYITPAMKVSLISASNYVCGDNSIPSGGEGGPGIAEGKERGNDTKDNEWGSLW